MELLRVGLKLGHKSLNVHRAEMGQAIGERRLGLSCHTWLQTHLVKNYTSKLCDRQASAISPHWRPRPEAGLAGQLADRPTHEFRQTHWKGCVRLCAGQTALWESPLQTSKPWLLCQEIGGSSQRGGSSFDRQLCAATFSLQPFHEACAAERGTFRLHSHTLKGSGHRALIHRDMGCSLQIQLLIGSAQLERDGTARKTPLNWNNELLQAVESETHQPLIQSCCTSQLAAIRVKEELPKSPYTSSSMCTDDSYHRDFGNPFCFLLNWRNCRPLTTEPWCENHVRYL